MILLTDGSVNTQSKMGMGAYLLLESTAEGSYYKKGEVVTQKFVDTSSTKLELETLLWAVNEVAQTYTSQGLHIYTDSQNTVGLLSRRSNLEASGYTSKNGKPKKHKALYQDFFSLVDKYGLIIHKIKGHSPRSSKTELEKFFSLVDKGARNALRAFSTGGAPSIS